MGSRRVDGWVSGRVCGQTDGYLVGSQRRWMGMDRRPDAWMNGRFSREIEVCG